MSKIKEEKTNVMRILEEHRIAYLPHSYSHADGPVDGVTVAEIVGKPVEEVFKTLVTRGGSQAIYVFVIPVSETLDLKKAARAVQEKSIAMVPVREINKLTGYVRGGCSPVGLKKPYPIYFDETVILLNTILVSAGKIGYQIEVEPALLLELVGGKTASLTVED